MEDRQELEKSIDLYKTQLRQVEKTLEDTEDLAQRQNLESLKNDLAELIDLTLQTINQNEIETGTQAVSTTVAATSEATSNQSLNFDDEMSCFMAEIKNLEKSAAEVSKHSTNDDSDDETFNQKLQSVKDELQNMIGKKCSAPHNHTWGQIAYHNAIICGLDETNDYELDNIKRFRFRILFTNPTHREMIPCSYYLNGDCKFTADRCHYSHGELIAVNELKDYQEPDFTKLNNENCLVLAKLDDNLWHKGKVIYSNFTEKSCRIRLINNKKEIDLNFEDLFPMLCDGEEEDSDSSSYGSSTLNSDDSGDYENDVDEIQKAKLIEKTLLNPTSNEALGDWEKHTRGIGSKLLKQMGYVFGAGLGANGEGIVIPISAQILPPGRSLDHCMELRENANGDKNLFSVEKKIKRQQKKIELQNQKAYENFTKQQNRDVFSFLNNTLVFQTSEPDEENPNKTMRTSKSKIDDLSKHSTKNLNIEYSKICDNIRKTEKEINKIKESMQRHSIGTNIRKQLEKQLNIKNAELCNYKKFEKNLSREQVSRKNKDELFVF